jgi:hypothetical protein
MESSLSQSKSQSSDHDRVRGLVTEATRLYAKACEDAGRELPPLDPGISTTEALTLACALLRSQDLTPFDMALWFSKGAPK